MTCQTAVTKLGAGDPVRGESKNYNICCTKVYAQTLFLGCSIQSFNASLGWGGEASRLTVELARDSCNYPTLYTDSEGKNPLTVPTTENDYINKKNDNTFTKDENGVTFTEAQMPTTDVFLNKIRETLDKWERFGYRYFIREGKCDSKKRKRGGRKSQKSKLFIFV